MENRLGVDEGGREMYKMIACDLDETLLSDSRMISRENIEAIRLAKQNGVKFVPATGRGYRTVQGTLKTLGLYDEEGEYVISFNGGAITENKNNRLLEFTGISYELTEKLFRFGLKYDVCIHIYTSDDVYLYHLNEEESRYLKGRMDGCIEMANADIAFLKEAPLVKVLYQNLDLGLLNRIKDDITCITDGNVSVSFSANRYIEFNQIGVDKGEGLIKLANHLGIAREETIAIGDNLNDASMIQAAGLGVCVKNAVEEMKPTAGYVCKSTNNENAIAEVIEKFIFRSQS